MFCSPAKVKVWQKVKHSLLLATFYPADGFPNCIAVIQFPIVLQQTNSKVIKLPILNVSGLYTKAVLSAFHSLRFIKSVWHGLPVCCHAAPHLALQQAPDCSWAGHRKEVINGLPYFKQQLENIGGTMQALLAANLTFIPFVFMALSLLSPNGAVTVCQSGLHLCTLVCLMGAAPNLKTLIIQCWASFVFNQQCTAAYVKCSWEF